MKNKTKYGINAIFTTIVVIVAVILINAIVSNLDSKLPLKIDLTEKKIYELSEHTKEVVGNIDKDIDVYALYPVNTTANQYITYAEEYMDRYSSLSKHFKVTYIDPYDNPNFAKKYEAQGLAVNVGSIILECGDKVEAVTMDQMYNQNSYTGSMNIDMERKLTTAVANVTGQSRTSKVYFTQGHDEYASVALKTELTNNGYICENIATAVVGIPEDCDLLIYMSPVKDLTGEERDVLDNYLDKGGKVIFFFEPGTERPQRLGEYLKEWGLEVRGDYVIETDPNNAFRLQNGLTIPAPKLLAHSINDILIERKSVFMAPSSSSIIIEENNIRNTSITPLMKTTNKAYGKTNLASGTLDKEEGDHVGEMILAAISENQGGNYGKIMVMGTLQAIELNGMLNESSYANGDFILNAAGYLTESNASTEIRPKLISASSLKMSQAQVVLVWIALQYLIPILIFVIGLVVWLKRRYK